MSYNIRNIREISNDPLTKFVNQLAKKLSKFTTEQQTEKLENKEDIYSAAQDVETVLRFNSINSTHSFDGSVEYYPTFEPDGEFNTCWIKGINIGNTTRDLSEFGNEATIYGEPSLIDGAPFDLGIHIGGVKSLATRFNRPTSPSENQEGMRIPHNFTIMVDNITVGISYFMRIRLKSLAQVGGVNRRLFEKVDQTGWSTFPEDGVMVCVSNAGRLDVTFRRGNTLFEKVTTNGALTVDTVHDIWIIFDQTLADGHADKIKVYIDNVDKSLSNGSSNYAWRSSLGNTDTTLSIMDSGGTTAHGHTYGDFYDFMIYRNKLISAAEVDNHYTNKWTIYDNPFGQNMISNYWAAPIPPPQQAYTTAGYTSTGYNT